MSNRSWATPDTASIPGPAAVPGQPPGTAAEETRPANPGGGLTSVDNALWLLQLVAERQALRVAEAADLLSVGRSTAHRLLSALRRRDFVMQDRPNGAYRPGPALNAIGMAAIIRIDIRRIAQPILEQLRDQTEETTTLAVLEGTMIRFVDCAESRRSVRVGNRTGVVRPAHASAVGKVLLADLPVSELRRRYPDEDLPPGNPAAIASRQVLEAELVQIGEQGYALNWEETIEGISAVAVALHDTAGFPLASISIAAPSSRMGSIEGIRAFAPAVLSAAEMVQERLHASG